ncbi:hypothetical protein NL676_012367 [Syzygium grande]|nr:hypothetical protein NL676_012367 [Syzygium grande]
MRSPHSRTASRPHRTDSCCCCFATLRYHRCAQRYCLRSFARPAAPETGILCCVDEATESDPHDDAAVICRPSLLMLHNTSPRLISFPTTSTVAQSESQRQSRRNLQPSVQHHL